MELPFLDSLVRLAVGGLCGLAVGVEREWSARRGGRTHEFAGVRTLLLLGLLGALAAELHLAGWAFAAGALVAGAVALTATAYVYAARGGDADATTEVAALLVLAASGLAGLGHLAVASGLAAVTALVLVEKSRIHALVYGIRSEEIEAAVRFAVLALVILPLLPLGPYGPPPGVRPRELWALVLLFSALSFAGYLGLRLAGPERGYRLAGLLGGLISSTAVTLSFARQSRTEPRVAHALASGALAASTVLNLRVLLLASLLNRALGLRLAAPLAVPLLAGVLLLLFLPAHRKPSPVATPLPKSPLGLRSALQMTLLFQAMAYALAWVRDHLGTAGLLGSAALLGLTDLDALTYSTARSQAIAPLVMARVLLVGLLANTLLKLALAVALGTPTFRRWAGLGLALLAVATGVGLALV